MSSFTQSPWPSWAYANEASNGAFAGYTQYPHYSSYLSDSMEAYQAHHQHLVHHQQMSRSTESKPRLSKEEVETLEAEFQKNHKPNSSTKKALAESMRVDNARINNWFQNRRAREKKERNIREYEARQKLEKQESGGEGAMTALSDRKLDLVASSAPFPNTERGPHRLSSSSRAVRASPVSDDGGSQALFNSDASNAGGSYSAQGSCTSPSNATSEFNDAEFALSTDEEDTTYCGKVIPQAMNAGDFRNPPSIFAACPTDQLAGFPPTSQSSSEDDLSLRSPASFDIASRRNRRPPPLAIDGRSCSAGASRAGLDMSRKGDSMRRVASATGSMRISKPMGASRSPYMLSRSPVTAGFKGNHAPPTPDTPVLGTQPAIISLDTGAGLSDMASRDPTLRTPPTTPGISQHLFNLNSIYDMPLAEAGLPSASVGRYNEGIHLPGVSLGTTHFITNAGMAQPHTPSFVSPMSHFGAEYAWP